ncbi:hypothetical protein Ana3638_04155 [Anaerocolumna sedimenticola]|uniref:Uncharacterized protein n=1 Tax=Anaerocolumna sedimenticola TaxID=2696063 RepID=A0A6P1TJ01_9FIRM|nr:hypothetical protein [Anaerocolumna sedimenticola]QHQ60072.1 hypothetical protein Ana3638_04155 [Anaerocolumna sedimenticola]
MLKLLYRIIILLAVFAASLFYFGRDIKEEVFDIQKTIEMGETSFPILTIRMDKNEMNLLHGYSNNLNANLVRDSITPLDANQSFDVVIDGKENDVKRVIYELRSVADNNLLETDTINALEKEEDKKTARIKFKSELEEGNEYAVKITLVTSESRKMNYYTRVKLQPSSHYEEKMDFVMDFHNAIMDRKKAENIVMYLEPDGDADNTSLSYVNIHSSFDLVRWGNLKPKVMGEIIPTINEINDDTASVELKYMISAETESSEEYYYVKEFYRVRYTTSRIYLLNYERTMESVFDINLTSLTKSELKLGITNKKDTNLVTSTDNNKLSFVSQRELWYYNLAENQAVKVFSFRQKNTDYVRDTYDEHDVKILNMDDDGNIDFCVYGYMNRGVYEGRVGIVLYKYYSAENRIEELVYIPMNVTYQMLKEELDSFSYVNQLDVYYFALNHKIYSYNLITKALTVIASDISSEDYVVNKQDHFIAWQNNSNPKKSTEIIILDLESGTKQKITASAGDNINLLGKIDNNFIYGFVKHNSISEQIDGSLLVPMYKINIADSKSQILKEYSKNGYYVSGITVNGNVITLERVKKKGTNKFESCEPDNILNTITSKVEAIGLTSRVTQKTLTEFYISLPSGFKIEEKPRYYSTINTIINEDTTLRLEDSETVVEPYTVYALGVSPEYMNKPEMLLIRLIIRQGLY